MKTSKIITIITIVILITILSVASFGGIYKLVGYKVKNVIPNYIFGKEFSKSRVIDLSVDNSTSSTKIYDKDGKEIIEQEEGIEYTEENGYKVVETKVNEEEALTKENFKKSKKIISKRLHDLGVDQYEIKLDDETGSINLDITENDETDEIIEDIISSGKFEILDSETQEVLLDNTSTKTTRPVYGQSQNGGTVVYLQIKFDKEGTKKLEDISNTYIETEVETTNESGEEETTTEKKEITIAFDGQELITRHFDTPITNGIINLPLGQATDNSTLQQYISSAKKLETLINRGVMPITYTQTNSVKDNSINIYENKTIVYSLLSVIVLAFIFLIIKLKFKGLLAAVLQIGYISLLLLVLRYTNIKITTTGIVGIAISIILNYIYTYLVFKNINLDFVKETTKKFAIRIIPFYIIAIIFTFNSLANISSLGMTLVWGIIIMYLYNLSLTQIAVKAIKKD